MVSATSGLSCNHHFVNNATQLFVLSTSAEASAGISCLELKSRAHFITAGNLSQVGHPLSKILPQASDKPRPTP